MDVLRAVSSLNHDICNIVLNVAINIAIARNVIEVVSTLKREVAKTGEEDSNAVEAKGLLYPAILICAIHDCAARFPQVAESVVHVLMD